MQQQSIPAQPPIKRIPLLLVYIACGIVAVYVLLPLLTMVVGSLRTTAELQDQPFSIPTALHIENYVNILVAGTFWQQLLNSLVTTLITVALLLVVSSPAAFIFARLTFPGREIIFNIILLGFLFPAAVAVLPLYITIRNLGLLNNYFGVILPQVAFGLPLTILILRNFFRAVPGELEDAAYMDGCTAIGFFWRILLPLSRPALAAVGMIALVGSWNNFLLPLIIFDDSQLWTLPIGVTQFMGQYGSDWAGIMAFVTLSMLPAVVFYLFAERQLIAGLTAGAVKG